MLFLQSKRDFVMDKYRKPISSLTKIVLLGSMAVMMLFVVSMLLVLVYGSRVADIRAQQLAMVLQNVLVFIAPVVLLALVNRSTEQRPVASTLWMTKGPSLKGVALVVMVYIIALPAMNYLVAWNEGLHLPQALRDVEQAMRSMEDAAKQVSDGLLATTSWGEMLLMVLLVGVLTGMGEEMFFRAGMLGSLHHGRTGRHVAVWLVAFLFSAIHMQFYGFVPRLLLGAWFGYVMLWSGEVWTPIIAHALNNSVVVVSTFLFNNHYISHNAIETLGVAPAGEFPWLAVASAVATAAVITAFMCKKNKRKI